MAESSYLNDKFFSRLETLALNLRKSLAGYFGGKHLVSTYGQTVEFSDFREYQLGDDIRRIDWNLYSRFEKYFLKLFTDERQMQVQIFLDCSASMGKDNPKKSSYAIAAAAALGFLTVHTVPFFLRIGARESEYENFLFTLGVGTIFYAIANALIVLALDSRGKNLDPRPLPLVGIYAHVMIKNKGGHLLQKYAENKPSQAKTVDSTMEKRNIIIGVTFVIGFVALHVYLLIGYLLYS